MSEEMTQLEPPLAATEPPATRPRLADARTPLLRQYLSVKEKHEDAVLFFRMGDFYETFFEDAVLVARTLGITLTSRAAGMGVEHCPMAGVPVHSVDRHLPRLIRAGVRVAICEQLEDPAELKGKRLVERGVIEVLTPGTLTDEKHLEAREANWLLSLSLPRRGPAGAAWLDVSAARLVVADLARSAQAVEDLVARVRPVEVLLSEELLAAAGAEPADHSRPADELDLASLARVIERAAQGVPVATLPAWAFDVATARSALHERFRVATLAGMGVEDASPSLGPAQALLRYVDEKKPGFLARLASLEPHRPIEHVGIDAATARSLEVVETFRGREREGTLLAVLDRTCTAMGARALRERLLAPLRDVAPIEERLDAVEALTRAPSVLERVREALRGVLDLERLAGRAAALRTTPRDLAGLRDSLAKVPSIVSAVEPLGRALVERAAQGLDPLAPLRARLEAVLADHPALSPADGEVIRAGVDRELDELREVARDGSAALARFQAAEVARTEIPSLKVGFNEVFGYFIEVTHAHRARVPGHYLRKQTLKNAERFVTDELKELEGKLLTARDRAQALEARLLRELKEEVAGASGRVIALGRALAELDAVGSLAHVARERGYVRPRVREGGETRVRAGRHPVIEAQPGAPRFVPNDLELGATESAEGGATVLVITGPNMAGKSTYIRQAALIVLLAQAGSFVPAESAEIAVVDRILARVGAADDLARGLSTFMVEMTEAANILRSATPRSLVILDEVGRGTSTYDGLSIAWAIAEHLHDVSRARTLFATHYHELTALERERPRVANRTVAVKETEGSVVFLRKIVPGAADKSYGLHVARLAGVPSGVVARAEEVLRGLEARAPRATPAPVLPARPEGEDRLLARLRAIDPLRTTPLEALAVLAELRALAGDGS